MTQLPKVLESKTKIRFQDCDPFNHLNNGSYLNYFMNHREDELIKAYNIDVYKLASTIGKSWLSSSNQIAYLKPALLMEEVSIQSQLIRFNDSELKVEMLMYNHNKTQLKAVLWATFVHFNLLKQKREMHSKEFMKLFKSINNPINANIFEDRLLEFKPRPIKSK